MKKILAVLAMLGILASVSESTLGESTESESAVSSEHREEVASALAAAKAALVRGPVEIPLANQAKLDLSASYGFVPSREARHLMKVSGNGEHPNLLGLVVPLNEQKYLWFVGVSYQDIGYVKDDDARNWNADELLENIRSGLKETNDERRARGIPELDIVGWIEKPTYDESSRQLIWSIESKRNVEPSDEIHGVNYNTLALGREGIVSMDVVTDTENVESLKPVAKDLLAGLTFNEGKRYADFNADTDKMAEYGLAALVAGVAAKKLGLFAIFAAFAVKFAKVIGVAAIAGGSVLAKKFSRNKNSSA